jgi:hypothetical protein
MSAFLEPSRNAGTVSGIRDLSEVQPHGSNDIHLFNVLEPSTASSRTVDVVRDDAESENGVSLSAFESSGAFLG